VRRRDVLALGLLAAVRADGARAQEASGNVRRIGFIAAVADPRGSGTQVGFTNRMRELGWLEGRNVAYEYRGHEGRLDRLPDIAAELVRVDPDLIVASGPEAALSAVVAATRTLPIIAIAVDYDPVARGYAGSLRMPGGNLTGVFFRQAEAAAKRLELLKEAIPPLARVAVLLDDFTTDASEQMRAVTAAAAPLGLTIDPIMLRRVPEDFSKAATAARSKGAEALLALMSPALFLHRVRLVETIARAGLPTSFGLREFAEEGALMSYGANLSAMAARAADLADRILKGTRPGELPIEQPTRIELVINLKAARALGIDLPPSILARADEVIE
jgi:putative tryptophan/tyrosine transport system substrate-binding protein